ncbi:MAG: EthD family reductase [Deltaproteobacteria bacterium]|nr:EthD family reductase [Deltaproteobacteria bacterium]
MVTLSFCYDPAIPFDEDYYVNKHLPLAGGVMATCGVRKVEMQKLRRTLNGLPVPYQVKTNIYFDSLAQLQACLKQPLWQAAVDDIRNYYGAMPEAVISFVPWAK